MVSTQTRRSPAWALAAEVPDPELPVVTIEDLGILRDVTEDDRGWVHVQITPTYSGCPAMEPSATTCSERAHRGRLPARRRRVRAVPGLDHRLNHRRGPGQARGVRRRPAAPTRGGPVGLALSVRCPQCGSLDTRESSRFGSTACKSLWVCRACREPFDHFKAL